MKKDLESVVSFEYLVKKFNAKIVNPIAFEQMDDDGYPIWSFRLNNDLNLNPQCDYILISRLELIRLIKEILALEIIRLIKDILSQYEIRN